MAAPKFPIDLRFRGGLSSSQKAAFGKAVARWQSVILAPLPAVKVGADTTKGLILEAQGVKIDGVGGILGQAGPTRLRPALASMGAAAWLPCKGVMSFDSDDLAKMEDDGILVDVITHEMGHVLGIGTVWGRKKRLVGAGTTNPIFDGPKAESAFGVLRGTPPTSVPVENSGGPGTRDSHWRERSFGVELMTGYVSPVGTANPLSRMTIASLEDIGYTVNYAAADPYSLPVPAIAAIEPTLVALPHCLPTIPMPA